MTIVFSVLSLLLFSLPLFMPALRGRLTLVLWVVIMLCVQLLWWQPRWWPASSETIALHTLDPLLRKKELQRNALQKNATVHSADDVLTSKEWAELPAANIHFNTSESPKLLLQFAQQTQASRLWQLAIEFDYPKAWRAELLDESLSLLHQSDSNSNANKVLHWVPPIAENVVLTLRLYNENDQLLQQGPIALSIQPSQPFNVEMLLASPGFDSQFLRSGFLRSNLRWRVQTQLGAGTEWQQRSDADAFNADIRLIDARRFEQASIQQRNTWLQQATPQMPLLLLDLSGQRNRALWQQLLQLELQPHTNTADWLSMAALQPQHNSSWQSLAFDQKNTPGLFRHQQKSVYWLSLQGWHQAQINDEQTAYHLWQQLFDALNVHQNVAEKWQPLESIAIADQRQDVCVISQKPVKVLLNQTHALQAYPSTTPNHYCTSFWPQRSGWHTLNSESAALDLYVYPKTDWPVWQQSLNKAAAKAYQTRSSIDNKNPSRQTIPMFLPGIVLLLSLLTLWRYRSSF